jgi:hypothetical protein
MRIKHSLWRVSNGWLLVPEDDNSLLDCKDAGQCAVFKTLKEFSDTYPKRERRKRNPKPTAKETTHASDQH